MNKFNGVLLACDMDGTLLDSDRNISKQNREALRYFTEQGGRFSLATGRAPGAVRQYFNQLPINTPYSLLNGALLYNTDHSVLQSVGMPKDTMDLIHTALSGFSQIGCEIFINDRVQVLQMSEVTRKHLGLLHPDYKLVSYDRLSEPTEWCKVNFTGEPAVMQQLRTALKPFSKRFSMAYSLPTFLEVTAPYVDKGAAVRSIAALCGIKQEHTYAIGDSNNDEPLLRAVYKSFAPSNADVGILEIADVTVSSNDESAVASVIEWLDRAYP